MAHLLGVDDIRVEYPTRVVLEGVTVGVGEGDRIGVVGRNGDGKSTLLRVLAGRQQPDSGRVTRRGGVTLGMLDQSDELPADSTVEQLVVDGRAEHEWAGDARVRDVIAGLLGGIRFDARVAELSGGQRRRTALAALLTRDWDVLVLDEPTNHLDLEGVAWLAEHLRRRWSANQGALLVVTHDRWFLDDSRVEAGGRKVLPHVCGTCSISKHRPRPRRSARLRSRFEGSTQADAVDSRPDSGLRDVVRADRLERREGHHRR